jgi:hypothetical protein
VLIPQVSNVAMNFGNLITQATGSGDRLFERMQPQLRLFDGQWQHNTEVFLPPHPHLSSEDSMSKSYLSGNEDTYEGIDEIALMFKHASSVHARLSF